VIAGLLPGAKARPADAARATGRTWRLPQRSLIAGALLLLAIIVVGLLAPVIYPGDPLDMVGDPLVWPGAQVGFPFGTDSMGRDVGAGLAHGARISLLLAFSATTLALLLGTVIGAVGGYVGGRVDALTVWLTVLFQTFPPFLLLIVLVAIAGPSTPVSAVAIGIVSWPPIARLARAEFRSLRQRDFVLACQGLGFGPIRIIFTEILPHAAAPIVVAASVAAANAVLMEAGLSFLGLSDPNLVSWGGMIGSGRDQLSTQPYLVALPALAIVLTVLSLNLLGDGLNDFLDPRRRHPS
jgi:peptide/nickel transport system permease protein